MNLNFPKNRRLLTYGAAGVFGCEAVRQASSGSWPRAHSLALAGSALLLIPTLVRNASWFGPVITRFTTSRREVWLTIDDGPDPADTPEILDVLGQYEARATFFGIGEKIRRWPYLASAIVRAGHQLQNHTLNHQAGSFWAALPSRVEREIFKCSEIIAEASGIYPTQFRSPVGLANPFVHAAAERAHLKMIGWSATGLDGIHHHPGRVVERILHSVAPGSIILTHEGGLPGMRQGTRARTLAALLKELRSRGYVMIIPQS